jgi:Flp pilus assembly protein TadD
MNAEDFLRQGINKNSQGDYQSAIACFNSALQINPDFAEVYQNRGNAY